MASLYPRQRSKYWWIEYIDAAGERRQESTKLRRNIATESKKAHALRDELTARELASAAHDGKGATQEVWTAWVPRFIEQRYAGSPLTCSRCEAAWRNLEAFLRAHEIRVPRQLTRQQVR